MDRIEEIIDRMLSVWNIEDPEERAVRVEKTLEHNVHFVDPPYNIVGRAAFLDMVAATRKANPGLSYGRASNVDVQNNFCRYDWTITRDSAIVMKGLDVVEFSDAGKILKVIGFFGPLEPLP
ncbi:MAG: nuclear transport factor 2 family protein [Litorimonas sp.]